MRILGHLLYVLAVVITLVVIAGKYFGVSIPNVTAVVMRDPAQSLLGALLLSLVSRWL